MTKYQNPKVGEIRLNDEFFAPRVQTNHTDTLPANIRKCHETGRIEAFRLDWKKGMPNQPHVFWDSDVAKVLEGMAYDLILNPDPEREKELDGYIDLICSAQQKDGYLNVFFTIVKPEERWTNLRDCHELYCAGHLMEAAVAHFRATGKRKFLDCMCHYADYIGTVFGRAPGQLRGYPGHEEIELALCKLAEASGNANYMELAKYFVEERGQSPNYFEAETKKYNRTGRDSEYHQAHRPVRDQAEAVGHAVRALYLYAGMADVAALTEDKGLFAACERLWESVVNRKMYVTGGVGSNPVCESFSHDYDLPNETGYAESCASIALVLFAERMLNATGNSKYADVMERALYNGAVSGLSLNGTEFFYANPQVISDNRGSGTGHMTTVRQPWFGCSCCPTNYCRFIPQIASFACSVSGNGLRINIPAAAKGCVNLNGGKLEFEIAGKYPYDGHLVFRILNAPENECEIAFRIPDWCRNYTVSECGKTENGYLVLNRRWGAGDEIVLDLEMSVESLHSHPMIEANAGKFVLRRGPLLYCLEGVDNGPLLSRLTVPEDQAFRLEPAKGLPGVQGITGKAFRETTPDTESLYSPLRPESTETVFHAIPYAFWQNRGRTSMILWIRSC